MGTRGLPIVCVLVAGALALSAPDALAQDAGSKPDAPDAPADPSADAPSDANRVFGVLPNYGTVSRDGIAPPLTTRRTFVLAAQNSFDPFIYPFVGFVAGLNQFERQEPSWRFGGVGYLKRYGAAFADNAIGNMMTTAVLPTMLGYDPRYYVLGHGTVFHRVAYAASRSLVTRTRDGSRRFNVPEIGGNLAAAGISTRYYPADGRTPKATLMRWGMQVLWDTASNESKEFWPDIRRRIRHRPQ